MSNENDVENCKEQNFTSQYPISFCSKKGSDEERHDFSPSEQEIEDIFEEFGGDLKIPENFEPTVEAFDPQLASYGKKVKNCDVTTVVST